MTAQVRTCTLRRLAVMATTPVAHPRRGHFCFRLCRRISFYQTGAQEIALLLGWVISIGQHRVKGRLHLSCLRLVSLQGSLQQVYITETDLLLTLRYRLVSRRKEVRMEITQHALVLFQQFQLLGRDLHTSVIGQQSLLRSYPAGLCQLLYTLLQFLQFLRQASGTHHGRMVTRLHNSPLCQFVEGSVTLTAEAAEIQCATRRAGDAVTWITTYRAEIFILIHWLTAERATVSMQRMATMWTKSHRRVDDSMTKGTHQRTQLTATFLTEAVALLHRSPTAGANATSRALRACHALATSSKTDISLSLLLFTM